MTPEQIDRVFGRGRLKMVTGEHVEVYREAVAPGERRRGVWPPVGFSGATRRTRTIVSSRASSQSTAGSPRPETGTQLDFVELHFEHRSWAGNRSFPQLSHFWTIRRPARAPSKKSRMSGVIAGMGLLISGIAVGLYIS